MRSSLYHFHYRNKIRDLDFFRDFFEALTYVVAMARTLFLSIIFIFTLSAQNSVNYYGKRAFKFNLSHKVKKSFKEKENFYIYRSFITGRKRGVPKELKSAMKNLNLLHLLTPSGLHLSSIFIIFFLIRRKLQSKYIDFTELAISLSIYCFLPGYYSLKRVALLRSLFLGNKQLSNYFSKTQVFLIFLIVDIAFGTFQHSHLSFAYSCLFLGLIFLSKEISTVSLSCLFFSAQVMMAYISHQEITPLSLIFSPALTWIFTLFYPLTFLNLIFIKLFNFSEWIIIAFANIITLVDKIASPLLTQVSWLMLLCAMIINRKTIYLCLGILCIHHFIY